MRSPAQAVLSNDASKNRAAAMAGRAYPSGLATTALVEKEKTRA
jgi:hypothetical protein